MNRREFVLTAASLAVAPRTAVAATRTPVALVTADLESHVALVDLTSARVLRRIKTISSPRSVERVGNRAVIAHSERGAVTILAGLRVAHVLDTFGEPRYTAAGRSGRYAYVTDAERGELVAVDVIRGDVVGRASVGLRARHVTINESGKAVWVALGSKALEIALVDVRVPSRPRVVGRFRPPFRAHDVGFAPDGRHAWVTSGDRVELAVYELRSGRIVARPSGDWAPQHVTFSRDRAYVTSGWSGTLRVHHLDGRPISETTVPVGSYNVQHGESRVVTPSLGRGYLTVLDERGRALATRRVARSSHDACVV